MLKDSVPCLIPTAEKDAHRADRPMESRQGPESPARESPQNRRIAEKLRFGAFLFSLL
ncbi:hypothetical protein ACFSQQ_07820 [Mesorhizobium kowhaii]|uniref:hypothetical protein n=1 Tax=Mesorhizobium kowhaii TaxID=1300272 RepID=UPI0035E99B87